MLNCRIKVMNFPTYYTEEMIRKICEAFGKVSNVELIRDSQGRFVGAINVEFSNELESKRA